MSEHRRLTRRGGAVAASALDSADREAQAGLTRLRRRRAMHGSCGCGASERAIGEAAAMQGRTMAVGVFEDPLDAWEALRALKQAGFKPDDIGLAVLQAPDVEGSDLADADVHRIRVDETTGILAGGVLGGVAGWLIGAAAVAVPGLGALVAAGALVGAVGGAGLGAAAGGLIGTLVEHGVSREEAEYYHEKIRLGAALVTVRDRARADEAYAILQQHGAHDYHTRPAEPRPPTR